MGLCWTGTSCRLRVHSTELAAALFLQGLGHDLLLEGGVFLISVKLIMMAYKNSVSATKLTDRLDELQSALARLERFVAPRKQSEVTEGPPNNTLPPTGGAKPVAEAEGGSRASGCAPGRRASA